MRSALTNLFVISFLSGCGASSFKGTSIEGSRDGATNQPPVASSSPTPMPSPTVVQGPNIDAIGDPSKCWFAVSGDFFGAGVFTGTPSFGMVSFPKTLSGNPIKTGERFSSIGVFLNARSLPYEYQKGGREIDKAVDTTFDSIAVTPGVSIELRNQSGKVIYKGDGPYIALSGSPTAEFITWFRSLRKDMPAWMVRYLEPRSFKPEKLTGLSPGLFGKKEDSVTWVKISKIRGASCE